MANPNEQWKQLLRESEQEEKKAKYSNQHHTIDGISFDSKGESRYYAKLKIRKQVGEILDFAYHVPVPLIALGGELVGYYEIDFVVTNLDGSDEWHDVKAFFAGTKKSTASHLFDWKKRHVKAQYGRDIILIDFNTLLPVKP